MWKSYLLQLTPSKHLIAHVALTAHWWDMCAEELSPIAHPRQTCVEEPPPTSHPGKHVTAHVALTARPEKLCAGELPPTLRPG